MSFDFKWIGWIYSTKKIGIAHISLTAPGYTAMELKKTRTLELLYLTIDGRGESQNIYDHYVLNYYPLCFSGTRLWKKEGHCACIISDVISMA